MYSKQDFYEGQLRSLGLMDDNAFTCACYMNEVGNKPAKGEVLSWAESSAVVYANSVLGAKCNRNSGIIDIMQSIVGFVPYFGLVTDEGRKATWIIEVKTTKKPEAQLLGSAIGMKVMEDVPYIKGLDKWLGKELDDAACTYLKDFGAATASNGAVGLYHVENLTPDAVEQGEKLITSDAKVYVIDDAELQRVYDSYPVMWKNKDAKPKLCFMGCPHMSLEQLKTWTDKVEAGLKEAGNKKVLIPTVFTAAPAVGTVASAMGELSDEAENPTVIMNKKTWSAFKAAQYAAGFYIDPFEGLNVRYNNSLPAYADASAGDVYMIVGDLGYGALANFPDGFVPNYKVDDMTKKKEDLVEILGKLFGVAEPVACRAFTLVKKPESI